MLAMVQYIARLFLVSRSIHYLDIQGKQVSLINFKQKQ